MKGIVWLEWKIFASIQSTSKHFTSLRNATLETFWIFFRNMIPFQRKCYIDGMEQAQYIRRPQLAARGVRHLESWRLLLAFFLDRSESNVRPSGRAAARSLPSFIAMLLKRGEGSVFPSWRLLLAFFFDRSESNIRPSDRAAAKPSVLHCHAVKAWRRIRFSELAAEKATLGLLTGQRREAFCPSLPCCYSMAKGPFFRAGGCSWHSSSTVQKATLSLQTGQRREAFRPSLPCCHAVKPWRRVRFPFRPSPPHCLFSHSIR